MGVVPKMVVEGTNLFPVRKSPPLNLFPMMLFTILTLLRSKPVMGIQYDVGA